MRSVLALFAVVAFLLVTSCATMGEHKNVVKTPSVEGSVTGSLTGALSGGTVGLYTSEVTRSQADTNKEFRFTTETKTEVTIESTATRPRYAKPGERIDLNCTYAVLSHGEAGVSVREKRELYSGAEPCGSLQVTVFRKPGTYRSDLPIFLPPELKPGMYTVRYRIETDRSGDERDAFFTTP
jgi:methionine-rich copper-binding protein CopC